MSFRSKRAAARHDPRLALRPGALVTVAGRVLQFAIETDPDPRNIDHVWIMIDAGDFGPLQIAISTCSRRNRDAGFDARMRVAIVESAWTILPRAGVRPAARLDYTEFEALHPCNFETMEREALEEMLAHKSRESVFVEAWGELYSRRGLGIHQVHSRRASCSVPQDVTGRDGALRFYFAADSRTETLLFKYCGQ